MSTATEPYTAREQLDAATRAKEDKERQERALSASWGQLMRTRDAAGMETARAARDQLRREIGDLGALIRTLEPEVAADRAAEQIARRRANVSALQALADALERSAVTYEAALQAPRILDARDAFIAAGSALLRELHARKLEGLPLYPELLGGDIYKQRTRRKGSTDHDEPGYNAPVPHLIAPVLAWVRNLKPEEISR